MTRLPFLHQTEDLSPAIEFRLWEFGVIIALLAEHC